MKIHWILIVFFALFLVIEPADGAEFFANQEVVGVYTAYGSYNIDLEDGQIAFAAYYPWPKTEILFYDGFSTTQITSTAGIPWRPSLNRGRIVWGDIIPGTNPNQLAAYYYDGTSITRISPTGLSNLVAPRLDGDQIVWGGLNGVFLYDITTGVTEQIFSGKVRGRIALHNGQIAWKEEVSRYIYRLHFYDGSQTFLISDEVDVNTFPDLHSGQIAWNRGDDLFFWDGTAPSKLPPGGGVQPLEISLFKGRVAWTSRLSNSSIDRMIFFYDGNETVQLTDGTDYYYSMPSLDRSQIAFRRYGRTNDGQIELVLAVVPQALSAELEALLEDVEALEDSGALNRLQARILKALLNGALRNLEAGRDGVARVQLRIFSATVQIYTRIGILSPEEGGPLLDRTDVALAALQ